MNKQSFEVSLNEHYGRGGLGDAILGALRESGKDPQKITVDDLSPVAEFHIGGLGATLELAQLAGTREGMRVLDLGSGLGGPARTLAQHFGCQVTGLDLTEEFCQVASMLSELTGMRDKVSFQHGNALEMPFDDSSFDLVWTQQASMNIEDKARMYSEVHRVLAVGGRLVFQDVLAVGGRLVFQDVLAGPEAPPHFPVPWARESAMSYLQPPDTIHELLEKAGFRETIWRDVTAQYLGEYRKLAEKTADPDGPPPLGIHLILGPDAALMRQNVVRNLEEQRIVLVQCVVKRT